MSTIPSADIGGTDLSLRFKLVNALPAALIIMIVGGLVLGGAPGNAPSLSVMVSHADRLGWFGAVAAIAILVVGALLLEPLEISSIRLLEGYWSETGPLARLAEIRQWRQEHQRSRLQFLARDPSLKVDAQQRLEERWPERRALLPTALGNRMRAFEERAGSAYGWKGAIALWPRLYYVLPESALATVNGCRNQLDVACRLCLSMLVTAVLSTGLLIGQGWWLLLPAVLVLGAWLSYRVALEAAVSYGIAVHAVIDVYHLKLHHTMRLHMPRNTTDERDINGKLDQLWSGDDIVELNYARTDTDVTIVLDDDQQSAVPDLYPG